MDWQPIETAPKDREPVDHPNSRVWRRHDGALIPYPGGCTQAEWQKIGDASYDRAQDLPDD